MDQPIKRICRACEIYHPIEDFPKNRLNVTERSFYCKDSLRCLRAAWRRKTTISHSNKSADHDHDNHPGREMM